MRKRTLGTTGLEVSELGLGTWGLSGDAYGRVADVEADGVIERARAFGITLYETADSYGKGAMEKRLGERLENDERAIIVTKWGTSRESEPPRKRFGAAYLRSCCEASLERLRRTRIHVALLHNPSLRALERDETTGTLAALVDEDKLAAWGVSAGSAEVAVAAVKKGARVVSLAYNLFHQSDFKALCETEGVADVGILAHSVLGYGLLTGQWSGFRVFRAPDHRAERWSQDELKRRFRQLDAVRPAIGGSTPTMRSVALRFVLSNSSIASAILGPKNSRQLDQLVREAGEEPYLPPEKLEALKNRLDETGANT
jgi:aryl-alcohol dehydrogenase-like predicted oxidoreductase